LEKPLEMSFRIVSVPFCNICQNIKESTLLQQRIKILVCIGYGHLLSSSQLALLFWHGCFNLQGTDLHLRWKFLVPLQVVDYNLDLHSMNQK
jgi:hypothetical protein